MLSNNSALKHKNDVMICDHCVLLQDNTMLIYETMRQCTWLFKNCHEIYEQTTDAMSIYLSKIVEDKFFAVDANDHEI